MFLRKQAAALKIQKSARCYFASKSYSELRSSAITLQSGLRTFGAYNEYILRKQKKASIQIQVDYGFILFLFYLKGSFVTGYYLSHFTHVPHDEQVNHQSLLNKS